VLAATVADLASLPPRPRVPPVPLGPTLDLGAAPAARLLTRGARGTSDRPPRPVALARAHVEVTTDLRQVQQLPGYGHRRRRYLPLGPDVTMFSDLFRQDRERSGLTIEQAARRLGVPLGAYRKLEAGRRWPDWTTYDRIAAAFGWRGRSRLRRISFRSPPWDGRASPHDCRSSVGDRWPEG
jgi:DNA-binding XRE family transcriptional regulator